MTPVSAINSIRPGQRARRQDVSSASNATIAPPALTAGATCRSAYDHETSAADCAVNGRISTAGVNTTASVARQATTSVSHPSRFTRAILLPLHAAAVSRSH